MDCKEKWCEHVPEGAVENEEVNLLWDVNIQCDNMIEVRRPDIVVVDKKEQKKTIIDIAVPDDVRVMQKIALLGKCKNIAGSVRTLEK